MELTKEQAIRFAESGAWKAMSVEARAEFQLYENRLCMPFSVFHEAVEKVLKRPVWTHEFAQPDLMELIPAEKRVVIFGG